MKLEAQQKQAILERFNTDEGFRNRALQDPNTAVKEDFGFELPFTMRVVLEDNVYRVEPVSGTTDDLTDDQLELVAGGKGWTPTTSFNPRGQIGVMSGGIVSEHGGGYR